MCGARCWSFSSTGGLAGVWKQWWTKSPRLKWRLRVISPLMYCVKNEPTPRKVPLGGKMGIFALAGLISATCLTCEVSEGGKVVCITGQLPVSWFKCAIYSTIVFTAKSLEWRSKALNLKSWVPLRVTRRGALDLCSSMNRHIVRLQARRPPPMFVTPEFATFSPESCPLIHTPDFCVEP